MNMHDSERLAGLLETAGYRRADDGADPDVVVFNTCAVRENADNRLYGNLGHLLPVKNAHPGMQIAVGGCLAQKDRAAITARAPWVDVVFGTHNIGSLPVLLERARVQEQAQVEILESLERFPSVLPARRESAYSAWVAISVGCNNSCTFCIVPSLRGREEDRRPGDVLAEIRMLAADGVLEVTLLGQNVNSYGVGSATGWRSASCCAPAARSRAWSGFASPARTRATSPTTSSPPWRRRRTSCRRCTCRCSRAPTRSCARCGVPTAGTSTWPSSTGYRAAMPDAAITTDIIVGFPGETEQDFCHTLDVVREARFTGAFTFQYSIRPGTPAAQMPGQVPPEVVQERYERLAALVSDVSWQENRKLVGNTVEVLVADGEGRKDEATHRMSGRAADNRLVHFAPGAAVGDTDAPRPGDVVTTVVTRGAPNYLLADGEPAACAGPAAGTPGPPAAPPASPAAPPPGHRTPATGSCSACRAPAPPAECRLLADGLTPRYG